MFSTVLLSGVKDAGSRDSQPELELCTCLDYYLDNVMASVPELAICLHSKGYVRSAQGTWPAVA